MPQRNEQHEDMKVRGPVAEAAGAARDAVLGGDGAPLDPAREQQVWDGRSSWKHYTGRIVLIIGWTVVAALIGIGAPPWLWWSLLVLTLAGWAWVAVGIAYAVFSCHYRLTTQRLFVERGLLSRTIDQTELIRVDDVRIHKTVVDRLCGLGSLRVMSTDRSDTELRLDGIAQPDVIADAIREHMRRLRGASLFVENL